MYSLKSGVSSRFYKIVLVTRRTENIRMTRAWNNVRQAYHTGMYLDGMNKTTRNCIRDNFELRFKNGTFRPRGSGATTQRLSMRAFSGCMKRQMEVFVHGGKAVGARRLTSMWFL